MKSHRPQFIRTVSIIALGICFAAAVTGSMAQSIDNAGNDFIVGFMPQISGNQTQLHLTGDVAKPRF